MHFSRSLVFALFSAPFLALAQDQPNPFSIPAQFQATAGEPLDLEWTPTTEGTVTLILRSGNSANLEEGTIIAENIENSGSYTWTPPLDTVRGSSYAIQIVDDQDPTQVNYTPQFVLESDNTVASTTNIVSLAAPTSSLELTSTATPTATPSAFPTTTGTSSETGSATESSSSMTETSTAPTESSSSTSEAAGARATAMAGLLGMVALGALAL